MCTDIWEVLSDVQSLIGLLFVLLNPELEPRTDYVACSSELGS
jgi:hypothetical protein